jgi:hypothetical protein
VDGSLHVLEAAAGVDRPRRHLPRPRVVDSGPLIAAGDSPSFARNCSVEVDHPCSGHVNRRCFAGPKGHGVALYARRNRVTSKAVYVQAEFGHSSHYSHLQTKGC